MNNQVMGTFRSRLNQLPLDLKYSLGEISLQIGMHAPAKKKLTREILNDLYHGERIDWNHIADGTNRFCFKYDGYVIKVALDREGIADNKQEFAICDELSPDVAYTHEISKGGHLAVATYCPAFSSYTEMTMLGQTIKLILEKWSKRYLLGDVGYVMKNSANWGISPDGRPVCIDYAYIFPASFNLFTCECGSNDMTFTDTTFHMYKCLKCNTVYPDTDLRMHISQERRFELFNNTRGILMSKVYEEHPIELSNVKIVTSPDMPLPTDYKIPEHYKHSSIFNPLFK